MIYMVPPGHMVDYPVPYFAHSEIQQLGDIQVVNIDLPADRQVGDFCCIPVIVSQENQTINFGDGFTELFYLGANFPNGCSIFLYYKQLDGTEPATLSWSTPWTAAHVTQAGVMIVRGHTGNFDFDWRATSDNNSQCDPVGAPGPTRQLFRAFGYGVWHTNFLNSYPNDLPFARDYKTDGSDSPRVSLTQAGTQLEAITYQPGTFNLSSNQNHTNWSMAVW